MRIDRMMTIIVILLNRKRVTAKELAEKFEVSVRTIYRDIDAIDMAGIPIISYAGNNGGFGIMENYKLDNQLLTLNNLCSLLTALKGINYSLEDMELESSIEKFRNLIPQDQADYVALHMDQLVISMPPWANTQAEKKRVQTIRQTIAQSQLVTISYRNYQNELSTRLIEPMSIIFKGYTWHLFAYCRLKEDYRVFKISRIIDIAVEDETFNRKNMSYYDLESSEDSGDFINLTLKFSPKVRARVEDIFSRNNIQVLNTGELLVTAEFPDKDWCFSLVLSFGEDVEVLGPKNIRQSIGSRIEAMYKKYK
jgi:predicted DNA-binding transcriptional regulator YafY